MASQGKGESTGDNKLAPPQAVAKVGECYRMVGSSSIIFGSISMHGWTRDVLGGMESMGILRAQAIPYDPGGRSTGTAAANNNR